jgi:type VI secretion system secreted protein VgrG
MLGTPHGQAVAPPAGCQERLMSLSQDNRRVRLTDKVGGRTLMFKGLTAFERISAPFEVKVMTLNESSAESAFDGLLGIPACVEVADQGGPVRHFHGRVAQVNYAGTDREGFLYELILRPEFWFMSHNRACRIFQDRTVPEIISELLSAGGVGRFDLQLTKPYPKRVYCVQYRESDFSFLSRLMEQEGMHYHFRHSASGHAMIIADANAKLVDVAGHEKIPFYPPNQGAMRDRGHFDEWAPRHSVAARSVQLIDFNFETPERVMSDKHAEGAHVRDNALQHDYPGGFVTEAEAKRYTELRLESERALRVTSHGSGSVVALAAGAGFELSGHPLPMENRRFIVVEARHKIEGDSFRSGHPVSQPPRLDVMAIADDVPFRPALTTPRPFIGGAQTAIVTGRSGEEIETDPFGRIKVMFHWDVNGKTDEKSSCWIRVAQTWAGAKWGALFTPRVGQEVLVEFIDGDPDRPIVTGSVYNGSHELPYDLPGDKTKSTIKSDSSKGHGGFNEMRFEDKKGSEELYMHAQKDMNVRVLNNLSTSVGNDEQRSVGHDRSTEIGNDQSETIGRHQDVAIGENDTLTVGNNRNVAIGKNQSIAVGDDFSLNAGQTIELVVGSSSIRMDAASITIKSLKITIDADVALVQKGKTIMVKASGPVTIKGAMIGMN